MCHDTFKDITISVLNNKFLSRLAVSGSETEFLQLAKIYHVLEVYKPTRPKRQFAGKQPMAVTVMAVPASNTYSLCEINLDRYDQLKVSKKIFTNSVLKIPHMGDT